MHDYYQKQKFESVLEGYQPNSFFEKQLSKGVLFRHGIPPRKRLVKGDATEKQRTVDESVQELQAFEQTNIGPDTSQVSDLAYATAKDLPPNAPSLL